VSSTERSPSRGGWETVDIAGDSPWWGKADSATRYDETLDETVRPACAWKYNHGPDVENPPETDLRRKKPLGLETRLGQPVDVHSTG